MSEHPGDTATHRFRAFWGGLLAFLSFGAILWLALQAAGPREAVEPGWAERSVERAKNLEEVRSAQTAALNPEAVAQALPSTVAKLKAKPAAKTDLLVPGSPTFLKQSQAPTPAPANPAPATPAPATPAPATPAPATPAPATPAPATPAPATPAPATPAPAAPAPAK